MVSFDTDGTKFDRKNFTSKYTTENVDEYSQVSRAPTDTKFPAKSYRVETSAIHNNCALVFIKLCMHCTLYIIIVYAV